MSEEQTREPMRGGVKKRIEVTVSREQVGTIRSCLMPYDHDDFVVRPVISGWTARGTYWSSEASFGQIGERVRIEFDVDPELIAPLIATGFGILSGEIVPVRISEI